MKYLITDPCYVVPKEEWSDFCDNHIDGGLPEGGYVVKGLGRITEVDSTQWGDGSYKMTKTKQVLVDSGTVCLVELDEGVTPTDYQGNAVTSREDTAQRWYAKAQTI